MSNDEILAEINSYTDHNWIWLEIWETNPYKIELVIIINEEEMCHLGQHKVIHVCSAQTDDIAEIQKLKARGKQLGRLIRRKFLNSHVHSRLYYRV